MKIFLAFILKVGIYLAGIFYLFYFCDNTKEPQGVEGTSLSCHLLASVASIHPCPALSSFRDTEPQVWKTVMCSGTRSWGGGNL